MSISKKIALQELLVLCVPVPNILYKRVCTHKNKTKSTYVDVHACQPSETQVHMYTHDQAPQASTGNFS